MEDKTLFVILVLLVVCQWSLAFITPNPITIILPIISTVQLAMMVCMDR